jgi:hypothetical protein
MPRVKRLEKKPSPIGYSVYPDLRPNLADVGNTLFRFLTMDMTLHDARADRLDVPERMLVVALLIDSVEQVTTKRAYRDRSWTREDARLWFLGELPETKLTFRFCCEGLGLDEEYFLKRLRTLCDLDREPKRSPARWSQRTRAKAAA